MSGMSNADSARFFTEMENIFAFFLPFISRNGGGGLINRAYPASCDFGTVVYRGCFGHLCGTMGKGTWRCLLMGFEGLDLIGLDMVFGILQL